MGTQFMPINTDALYLGNLSVRTRIKCANQCHFHHRCRTFNFDTSTDICQLYQGDSIATGTIMPATQTLMTGSIKLMRTFFDSYGQHCDYCQDNRFLRCVNDTCDCQQNTYWNGTICLPQLPMLCMECQPNRNMCRTDLNLTCQSYNKCDYSNQTCNVTDIHTTEAVYSTATTSIGSWILLGNMSAARSNHISVLLSSHNDTVLIAGGCLSTDIDVFFPANQSFVSYGQLLYARAYFTAIEIPLSGHVLFVGGNSQTNAINTANFAELFNYNSRVVTTMIPTTYSWARHTMVFLLSLSKWLLLGGIDERCEVEIFDPVAMNFFPLNHTGRINRTAIAAALITPIGSPNDIILITGGEISLLNLVLPSAELFNVSSGEFIILSNNLTSARCQHTATALSTLGKVLICGGLDDTYTSADTCEIYDHVSGNFSSTKNPMSNRRFSHTATLLNNGEILITGGTIYGSYGLVSTDLYNPITNTFLAGAPLNIGRFGHTATLLPKSGNVLICGGMRTSGVRIENCELFYP